MHKSIGASAPTLRPLRAVSIPLPPRSARRTAKSRPPLPGSPSAEALRVFRLKCALADLVE